MRYTKCRLFLIPSFCPRMESKDLRCKSLHFVYIRERMDQKKVCKFANFAQWIYADTYAFL